jgi:hypothetical protein
MQSAGCPYLKMERMNERRLGVAWIALRPAIPQEMASVPPNRGRFCPPLILLLMSRMDQKATISPRNGYVRETPDSRHHGASSTAIRLPFVRPRSRQQAIGAGRRPGSQVMADDRGRQRQGGLIPRHGAAHQRAQILTRRARARPAHPRLEVSIKSKTWRAGDI